MTVSLRSWIYGFSILLILCNFVPVATQRSLSADDSAGLEILFGQSYSGRWCDLSCIYCDSEMEHVIKIHKQCHHQMNGSVSGVALLSQLSHFFVECSSDLRNYTRLVGDLQAFRNLTALESVEINRCGQITGDLAAFQELRTLTSLAVAELYRNVGQMYGNLDNFASLTKLTELFLVRVAMDGYIDVLSNLTALQKLALSGLPKVAGNFSTISKFHKLEFLKLQTYGVHADLASLGNLTRLAAIALRFADSYTAHGNIESLSKLSKLSTLYIWGMNLTGNFSKVRLKNLQKVQFSLNNSTMTGCVSRSNTPALTQFKGCVSSFTCDLHDLPPKIQIITLCGPNTTGNLSALRKYEHLRGVELTETSTEGQLSDLPTQFSFNSFQLTGTRVTGDICSIPNLRAYQEIIFTSTLITGDLSCLSYLDNGLVPQMMGLILLQNEGLSGTLSDLLVFKRLRWLAIQNENVSGSVEDLQRMNDEFLMPLVQVQLDGVTLTGSIDNLNLTELTVLVLMNVGGVTGDIKYLARSKLLYILTLENVNIYGDISVLREHNFLGELYLVDLPNVYGSITSLQDLRRLSIINIQNLPAVGSADFSIFSSMSQIGHLQLRNLDGNSITGSLEALGMLTNLQILCLENIPISGQFKDLQNLQYLQLLGLKNMGLHDNLQNLCDLGFTENLIVLHLDGNSIYGDYCLSSVYSAAITISQNKITGKVKNLGDVNLVYLTDNYISCDLNANIEESSFVLPGNWIQKGTGSVTDGMNIFFVDRIEDELLHILGYLLASLLVLGAAAYKAYCRRESPQNLQFRGMLWKTIRNMMFFFLTLFNAVLFFFSERFLSCEATLSMLTVSFMVPNAFGLIVVLWVLYMISCWYVFVENRIITKSMPMKLTSFNCISYRDIPLYLVLLVVSAPTIFFNVISNVPAEDNTWHISGFWIKVIKGLFPLFLSLVCQRLLPSVIEYFSYSKDSQLTALVGSRFFVVIFIPVSTFFVFNRSCMNYSFQYFWGECTTSDNPFVFYNSFFLNAVESTDPWISQNDSIETTVNLRSSMCGNNFGGKCFQNLIYTYSPVYVQKVLTTLVVSFLQPLNWYFDFNKSLRKCSLKLRERDVSVSWVCIIAYIQLIIVFGFWVPLLIPVCTCTLLGKYYLLSFYSGSATVGKADLEQSTLTHLHSAFYATYRFEDVKELPTNWTIWLSLIFSFFISWGILVLNDFCPPTIFFSVSGSLLILFVVTSLLLQNRRREKSGIRKSVSDGYIELMEMPLDSAERY